MITPASDRGVVGVVTEDRFVTDEMKALLKAARRRRVSFFHIDPETWSVDMLRGHLRTDTGKPVHVDAVLGRLGSTHMKSGIQFMETMRVLHLPMINDGMAHLRGRHKAICSGLLIACHLPHPPTWYLSRRSLHKMASTLPYPIVYKPVLGSQGRGLRLLVDERDAKRLMRHEAAPYFLQKYVPAVGERRLFIIGDQVVAAVSKRSAEGEWRANRALGAVFRRWQWTSREGEMARRATSAVGAHISAVDLLHTTSGPVVLEVNVCPQFTGMSEATDVDIARLIIDALIGLVEVPKQ